eukprot:gene11599-12652_t
MPTKAPTKAPTNIPTFVPTITPTFVPTITPTIAPTTVATIGPTIAPYMYMQTILEGSSIQAADTSIPYPTILGRDPTTGVIYFTAQASAIMLSTVLTARPTNAPTIKPTGAPSTASPSLQFPERGSYYYVQTIIDGSKQWPMKDSSSKTPYTMF